MKKNILLSLGFLLISLQWTIFPVTSQARSQMDGPEGLLDLAESMLNGKNYPRAEATYKEVLSIDRDNDTAYFKLGLIAVRYYHHSNNALYYFNKAIELNGANAEYYINRGAAYAAIKDWEQAIKDYTTALGIEPNNAWALSSRARSYEENKQADKAIADYEAAIRNDPQGQPTYEVEIARVSVNLGAEIEKTKKNSGIFLERAIMQLNRGEHMDLAEEDLKTTIDLDSKNDWAHFLLGKILAVTHNDTDAAIKEFSKAIELNETMPEYYLFRGKLLGKTGEFKKGLEDFNIAIKLDPSEADPYFYRGVCQMELGLIQDSRNDFIRFKQLDPGRRGQADKYLDALYQMTKKARELSQTQDKLRK
ncbi:MAG: tetratricopeptide repeat protein [Desulfobulbaceae bacterium]|nr:tetratricopeptide repeat protein [Desulfobulbaceae bacterium]